MPAAKKQPNRSLRALRWQASGYAITSKQPPHGTRLVKGFIAGPFGLRFERQAKQWVMTHRRTGLRIAAFRHIRCAREFAERILPLTNWDSISGPICTGHSQQAYCLFAQIVLIRDEITFVDELDWSANASR